VAKLKSSLPRRYRDRMAEVLTLTLTLEARGPAGAFLLSDDQVATEAKRDATRTQRVTKTIEMLRAGEHR
jgi:hypothetical protein